MSRLLLFICFIQFQNIALVQGQSSGTLLGIVIDSKTQEPLIGATVTLEGTEFGSVTNAQGRYEIQNIPTKTYNVAASFIGYESSTKFNIVVRSEGNIALQFALKESTDELQEVVVIANPFQKLEETPLSIQKLSQEEIAAYPGGNNDIAKVVQSLPGVSGSVGGFRNDVIIRGGAPNENVYYLDGIEIPNINHFSTQGSAGGPVGLLNVSFFEGVTLESSAFGAQYDNVLSGVLQFDQRNGNSSKFGGNVRVGASESALTLEGPLFKKEADNSKTTFIASVRRSYLQFLFKAIGLPFLPDYWDFQYKLNHQIDDYNEVAVSGIGSIDDFSINPIDEFDEEQQAIQDQVPVIQQWTLASGLSWKRRFKDNSGYMRSTLSTNMLDNQFQQFRDNENKTGLYFNNDSRESAIKFRYQLTKFAGEWTIVSGLSLQKVNYSNTTTDLVNTFNYATSLAFTRYGGFGQVSRKFLNERLGLSFGLRFDGNSFTNNGHEVYRTASPRLSASYKLSPTSRWTASASLGRYYKIPPYTVLGFRNNLNELVNKNVRYISNDHLTVGLEYLMNQYARFSLEGFLKYYDNYPVSINEGVSLANLGGGFEVLGNEPVSSVGLGRTYGLELLFQQKFNGRFYAIAAFTYYKSEYTGLDKNLYLPSTWDNRVLLSLTSGYKMNKNWEISTRYRFLGKTPYAPIDESATLANYPAIINDYRGLGTVKLKPFSQLDLRVDKKWSFKKWSLDIYLDIQNLLLQDTPQVPRYGLARNDVGDPLIPNQLVTIESEDGGSVIPSVGIVVNF